MNVGIRDLKEHLSQYLARVREGEEVIITDRGTPVARLEPLRRVALPAKLQRLIGEGRVIDKGPLRDLRLPIRIPPGDKSFSDYVREQRR